MPTYNYEKFTRRQVELIHSEMSLNAKGFSSEGNLDFIINTIDFFPETAGIVPKDDTQKVLWMVSYLLFHLLKGHCFNDGNKRTAFSSAGVFLNLNGLAFNYNEEVAFGKIKMVEKELEKEKSILEAIAVGFGTDKVSTEYQLTVLIFGLAGAAELPNYHSPIEVFPILSKLVVPRRQVTIG